MPNLRIDFTSLQTLLKTFDVDLKDISLAKKKELIMCAAKYVEEEVKLHVIDLIGKYSLKDSTGGLYRSVYIDESHMKSVPPYAEIRFKGNVSKYYEPRPRHPRHRKVGDKYVWFSSTKKGTIVNSTRRIEEIAFLNEYGVPGRKIEPRPFMKESMDKGMNRAINDLLDILEDTIANKLAKII